HWISSITADATILQQVHDKLNPHARVISTFSFKSSIFKIRNCRYASTLGFMQKTTNLAKFFVNLNIKNVFKMDIQTAKLELLKAILDSENSEFIQRVSDFVKKEKNDFWNELSLSEQKEIKKGIEDLDNGKRISYDSFLKKIS